MKLYEITIQPMSGFGTPLKGDTLFGHFCWQAVHNNLLEGDFEDHIREYAQRPFAVFSSAVIKIEQNETVSYALRRPDVPPWMLRAFSRADLKSRLEEARENKKRTWMVIEQNELARLGKRPLKAIEAEYRDESKELYQSEADLLKLALAEVPDDIRRLMQLGYMPESILSHFLQPHNSINRMTQSTGAADFAPYATELAFYLPETRLAVFVLIDDAALAVDKVVEAMESIGVFGFGKDASVGMGRFTVAGCQSLPLPDPEGANACFTLAPCVPEKKSYSAAYYSPFIRFGKHGDLQAKSRHPFKNPVIMADEGAVFKPTNDGLPPNDRPYIGRAVTENVSLVLPETVVQGYTPIIPIQLEFDDEQQTD